MGKPHDVAARLLEWYDRERRDLPWRRVRDPWAIWVSEVMLQQTRVEVVRALYPGFLQRFPGPRALAAASDDDLLAAWQGLGYYRRARLLRDAARVVLTGHSGGVPRTAAELADLPGVGEYTAGAIASIAYGERVAAVDGNVQRVVARHRGIAGNVRRRPGMDAIRAAVSAWLHRDRPGDFNQALMELGAVVCSARSPQCRQCPLVADCVAHAQGRTDELPRLPGRRPMVDVLARAVLAPVRAGQLLATRIPDRDINGGQVDLPGAGILVPTATPTALQDALRRRFGVSFRVGEVITAVNHAITHHRIHLVVHRAQCARGSGPNLMALRPDDPHVPWTTTARKVFRQAALFLTAN